MSPEARNHVSNLIEQLDAIDGPADLERLRPLVSPVGSAAPSFALIFPISESSLTSPAAMRSIISNPSARGILYLCLGVFVFSTQDAIISPEQSKPVMLAPSPTPLLGPCSVPPPQE